jgi:hypothetical protein
MRMPMRVQIIIRPETPYPIITHDPVHQAFFIQPIKYAIQRNPIQPALATQTLLNLLMGNRTLLGEQHCQNADPARRGTLSRLPDEIFRLLLKMNRHIWYHCNRVAFTITAISDTRNPASSG